MPKRIGFQKDRQRRRTFIKDWREHRGLSQEELGEKVGTSGSMISRIETGETPYTQDSLEAIAVVLRVPPWSLLNRDPKSEDDSYSAIWDGAKSAERRLMVDLFRTARGKIGADE